MTDGIGEEAVPFSALGLDLMSGGPDDQLTHPIAVVVVAKFLENQGFSYRMLNSDGVNAVDALGLLAYAKVEYEDIIRMGTLHRGCGEDGECTETEDDS